MFTIGPQLWSSKETPVRMGFEAGLTYSCTINDPWAERRGISLDYLLVGFCYPPLAAQEVLGVPVLLRALEHLTLWACQPLAVNFGVSLKCVRFHVHVVTGGVVAGCFFSCPAISWMCVVFGPGTSLFAVHVSVIRVAVFVLFLS